MKVKQTVVEYLINNIIEDQIVKKSGSEWEEIFNQANKMFEQQIIDAYKYSVNGNILAEQYYNETFGESTPWYDEDQTTERMNVIGQNGNEGEHYNK